MQYGIVIQPVATIYEIPAETVVKDGMVLSAIADEAMYGTGLAITGPGVIGPEVTGAEVNGPEAAGMAVIGRETDETGQRVEMNRGYLPVRTFYGYTGYVRKEAVRLVSLEEMMAWEEGGLMVTTAFCVDVVSVPKVQGVRLVSLFRGSLVSVIPYECGIEGWGKVKLADGRFGYIREQFLENKEFSQAGLWTETLPQKKIVDKEAFRRAVVETAKTYLGIQYRWGGRYTAGIEFSGLTSVSYMMNGILTWRDAKIVEGYPVREIAKYEMKMGDLLYFPGHIAMYMGDGRYIHSTGKAGSGGVVNHSLNPEDADFRADLAESLYAAGSIF